MSARMSVSKPTALRKSTLALHRMKSKDHEGFEDVRQFVKQVKFSAKSNVLKMKKESPTYIIIMVYATINFWLKFSVTLLLIQNTKPE